MTVTFLVISKIEMINPTAKSRPRPVLPLKNNYIFQNFPQCPIIEQIIGNKNQQPILCERKFINLQTHYLFQIAKSSLKFLGCFRSILKLKYKIMLFYRLYLKGIHPTLRLLSHQVLEDHLSDRML